MFQHTPCSFVAVSIYWIDELGWLMSIVNFSSMAKFGWYLFTVKNSNSKIVASMCFHFLLESCSGLIKNMLHTVIKWALGVNCSVQYVPFCNTQTYIWLFLPLFLFRIYPRYSIRLLDELSSLAQYTWHSDIVCIIMFIHYTAKQVWWQLWKRYTVLCFDVPSLLLMVKSYWVITWDEEEGGL